MAYVSVSQREKVTPTTTSSGYVPVADRKISPSVVPVTDTKVVTPKVSVWDVIKGIPQAAVDVYKPLIQPEITGVKNLVSNVKNLVTDPKAEFAKSILANPKPTTIGNRNEVLTAPTQGNLTSTQQSKKESLAQIDKMAGMAIGFSGGLKITNGMTDELASQYAKEFNALKIEKDLINKGVSEYDAKAISPELAKARTPNAVKQVVFNYGTPTEQAAVKQIGSYTSVENRVQALETLRAGNMGDENIVNAITKLKSKLPVLGETPTEALARSEAYAKQAHPKVKTKPVSVPDLNIKLPENASIELQQRVALYEINAERLANSYLRPLTVNLARSGEFKGQLPEVSGQTKADLVGSTSYGGIRKKETLDFIRNGDNMIQNNYQGKTTEDARSEMGPYLDEVQALKEEKKAIQQAVIEAKNNPILTKSSDLKIGDEVKIVSTNPLDKSVRVGIVTKLNPPRMGRMIDKKDNTVKMMMTLDGFTVTPDKPYLFGQVTRFRNDTIVTRHKLTNAERKTVEKTGAENKDGQDWMFQKGKYAEHLKFDSTGRPLAYTSREQAIVNKQSIPFMPSTPEQQSLIHLAEQQGLPDPRIPQAVEDFERMVNKKELYKWNNVREAMGLPDIPNMSFDQIKKLDSVLSQYPKKTEFLTTRQLQTLHNTKLAGMRTVAEVLANLKKVTGTVPSDVIKSQPHPWMYDTQIYRQDPFWKLVLDTYNPLYLRSTASSINIQNISNNLIRAARKSRPRSIGQKLVPTDERITKYLEAPLEDEIINDNVHKGKLSLMKEMTPEEIKAAQFQEKYNREVYDWKLKEELEKKFTSTSEDNISRFKDIYFHHTARPFFEAWKNDGFIRAVREATRQFEQSEAVANILNEKTGDILPYDKWIAAFQFRTGHLIPSQNAALAFNTYVAMIEKAKLFNEMIPEMMTYAHVLGPRLTTSTGLEVDDTLQMGLRKWINTKKGRVEKQIIVPGSKLDWAVRTGVTLLRVRDLALNVGIQLASPFGEQSANIIMLRTNYFKAIARQFTKQGKIITRKYENFVGKRVYETLTNPDMDIGKKVMGTIMSGFSRATRAANKTFLLGSMTKEEFRTGIISEERLGQLRIEMGRFRNVHDANSVFGKSAEAKVITQYKQWAIPAITTTAHDFKVLAKMVMKKDFKNAVKSKEFKELLTMALLSAGILIGTNSYYNDLNKKGTKRTFVEDLIFKTSRDAMSMLGALNPTFIVGFAQPRLVSFFVDMATALTSITKLEEYQTGVDKGKLKGIKQVEKILTPVAVSQFIGEPKKKSLIDAPNIKLPSLPTLPALPKLPKIK